MPTQPIPSRDDEKDRAPRYALGTYTGRDSLERHLRGRLRDMLTNASPAEQTWLREAELDEALDPEAAGGALYDHDSEDLENLVVCEADMPAARRMYAAIRDELFWQLDDGGASVLGGSRQNAEVPFRTRSPFLLKDRVALIPLAPAKNRIQGLYSLLGHGALPNS